MTSFSPKPEREFVCDFCQKAFTTEKRKLVHMCEKKRRVLQREERPVQLGFAAYSHFWTKCQNPKAKPDWTHFEKSDFYAVFVKFGYHLQSIHAINPIGFIDFLLRAQIGVDRWCDITKYQAYIREMTKNETPLEALQRSLILMDSWANQNNELFTNFFHKIATPQAVLWILSGRISPLILLTASSAGALFDRLSEEQATRVAEVIDEQFWESKMRRHQKDIDIIVAELAESGL
jgi:hypothetical protein